MKKIFAIGIVIIFIATIGVSVSAKSPVMVNTTFKTTMLYEKNTCTWEIIDGGAWGRFYCLERDYQTYVETLCKFAAYGLEPDTDYTIIAYHEDWPNVDFIGEATTDSSGYFINTSVLNFTPTDKIWVVLTSDICGEDHFINWNPSEYLFENNLI